ncbi:MAG: DUF2141 domain-containing protein [bacterium]|nr:DUF2141 domain-containing protein [bacterium]
MKRLMTLAVAILGFHAPVLAGELAIDVTGIRSDDGRVFLALHQDRADVSFPDDQGAVAGAWMNAVAGTLSLVFPDLAEGHYAVSVMHDENGDGELDANLLGVPTEGYGFSNDATGFMGPPDFSDASVEIGDEPFHAVITLRY